MSTWIPWTLYVLCFIYNMLDVYHTKMLLSVGAVEVNPIMNWFIQNYGVNSLYGVKLIIFLWLGILLYTHQKRRWNEQNTLQL